MAGMPLRKYIKIDLSILDNTSWAGAAGIGHRDDVSSWLRAICNLRWQQSTLYRSTEETIKQRVGSCAWMWIPITGTRMRVPRPYFVHNVLPVHCTQLCRYRKD